MYVSANEAIGIVAERTLQNTIDIKQKNRQRRNQVVDIYGTEYTRQGDGNIPATFYISISPDMIYLERFEFKLIIQPFVTTVSGNSTEPETVTVNNRNLTLNTIATVSGQTLELHDDVVTPNPHNHTTQPHSHSFASGVGLVHTASSNFNVTVEGINVTPYLMAQYGEWISGEGVYPSLEIGQDYDLLEVGSDLMAEGREDLKNILLAPGYKPVSISSDSPFQVTLVLYLKYSHLNR